MRAALLVMLVLCALAPLALPAGGARADAPGKRRFRELLGLGMKFSQGQPLSQLSMLADLGVGWVRDGVLWHEIETAPGVYEPFPAAFEQRLAYYRARDIGLVFLLAYANPVAYPPTPGEPFRVVDPAAFGRYAVEMARRLKAAGVRFTLEVWNEPHNFVLREMIGGEWNGKAPSPWVDHYVRMVREVVHQTKALDRQIPVLTDDDMWVIHYWYLEAGLPKDIDGFAVHPYTKGAPELATVGPQTDWVKPFTAVDEGSAFGSAVRRLRQHAQQKLGRAPQVWITEWGWGIGSESEFGPVSEELLAALLPRAYLVAQAAGVEVLCWFSAQDSVDGPMGLLTNDGRKRKSYTAFKTMSRQLGAYFFERQVLGQNHPTTGVQGMLFRGKRDHKLAIWNVDAAPKRLALRGSLQKASAVDALGKPVRPEHDASAEPYLKLGRAPLYLANVQPEGDFEAYVMDDAPAKTGATR